MNFFQPKNILLILGDIGIAILSVYNGVYLRFYFSYSFEKDISRYTPVLPKAAAFAMVIVFMCFLLDLYNSEKRDGRKETILKILFSGVFASFALAAFYFFIPYLMLGRGIFIFALCLSIIFQSIWHVSLNILGLVCILE